MLLPWDMSKACVAKGTIQGCSWASALPLHWPWSVTKVPKSTFMPLFRQLYWHTSLPSLMWEPRRYVVLADPGQHRGLEGERFWMREVGGWSMFWEQVGNPDPNLEKRFLLLHGSVAEAPNLCWIKCRHAGMPVPMQVRIVRPIVQQ